MNENANQTQQSNYLPIAPSSIKVNFKNKHNGYGVIMQA